MAALSGIYTNYLIPAAMSRSVVIGAGILGAIPAIEMAARTFQDYSEIQRHNDPLTLETKNEKTTRLARKEKSTKEMVIHGLGALILGGCALNPFTGSGVLGLAVYLAYARFSWEREFFNAHPCITTVSTGFALQLLPHVGKQLIKSMASAAKNIVVAIGSFLHVMVEKAKRIGQPIIHGMKAIAKIGIKLILLPLKIFRPFIRHPILGLGLLMGVVCLIGCVKYSHRLIRSAAATSYLLHQTAHGVFYAGSLLFQGLSKSVKPIGTALYYLPSVVIKTVQGISSIVHFIFHPLQRMGMA